jgi:hypothetical protein
MFRRTTPDGEAFTFTFEDRAIAARPGDSVAAALVAAGIFTTRTTPATAAPRGMFCMMGACFDCLAEIDGVGNLQTCLAEARPGLAVRRQVGARDVAEEDAA